MSFVPRDSCIDIGALASGATLIIPAVSTGNVAQVGDSHTRTSQHKRRSETHKKHNANPTTDLTRIRLLVSYRCFFLFCLFLFSFLS